ncbi:MAG: hypothetical protein OSA98_23495 [Rubripirellula sp.]|nr:hypothetical protein [Rubripirellula sp.]
MVAGDPAMCNNDPLLAAAAIAMDIPRAQSIEQARPTPLMTNPIQSRKRTLSQGSGLSVKEADSQSRKRTRLGQHVGKGVQLNAASPITSQVGMPETPAAFSKNPAP